jgi:hypothetical protein
MLTTDPHNHPVHHYSRPRKLWAGLSRSERYFARRAAHRLEKRFFSGNGLPSVYPQYHFLQWVTQSSTLVQFPGTKGAIPVNGDYLMPVGVRIGIDLRSSILPIPIPTPTPRGVGFSRRFPLSPGYPLYKIRMDATMKGTARGRKGSGPTR